MNRPGTIKYLHSLGLPQKHIQIITDANQAYISKVIHGKIREKVEADPVLLPEEQQRLSILTQLLELRELPGQLGLTIQDCCYIKLLHLLMVKLDDISILYYEVPKKILSQITRSLVDVHDFDSELFGIPRDEYLDFIHTLLG